ncbi:hypothetical protein GCM10009624_04610 [Gordonia sinesedis]
MTTPTSRVADWAEMRRWCADQIAAATPGLIVQLGPRGLDPDATDVPSVEVHALTGGTYLVRLSTRWMHAPMLAGYSVPRAALNRWRHDGHFPDCTDGYLATRSPGLIADICVTWFADRCGFAHPDDVGYSIVSPPSPRTDRPSRCVRRDRGTP